MIFPCMELFLVIFQVFHDFQVLWEPCHLEVLSLKGGSRGSSESTYVKMPHCWKSHALAHYLIRSVKGGDGIAKMC